MKLRASICTLLLAVLALGAPAWAANVQVCHVPPGDPGNFHTITISDNALPAHLAHGDLLGSCNSHCDQLCNDGNACTIDACDGADHCALTHPPVNCDDGNLCTTNTCNPATGCSSTPKTCLDGNLCTVDSCDPLTGNCVFPPAACPSGQTCNAANGSCEGSSACTPNPCQNGGTCSPGGGGYSCTCPSGWTGTNCETDINECAATPYPCAESSCSITCENTPGSYFCLNPDWTCY